MTDKTVTGEQVNVVIRCVVSLTKDGDEQLAILANALAIACKSCSVSKEVLLEQVEIAYDRPTALVPLDEAFGKLN